MHRTRRITTDHAAERTPAIDQESLDRMLAGPAQEREPDHGEIERDRARLLARRTRACVSDAEVVEELRAAR